MAISYPILQSLQKRLQETGVYRADGTTLVDCELSSYAAAFQPVLNQYDELLRELALETAESYGLTMREQLVGRSFAHLPLEVRRESIRACLSVRPGDCTKESLERLLSSVGIVCTITEEPETASLLVTVTDVSNLLNPTQTSVQEIVLQYLPAHRLIRWDFSALEIT